MEKGNKSESRSSLGLVIVFTVPPRPQFAAVALAQADFGKYGEVSAPSATASSTAALLFARLNTCASGSSTYLSRNLKVFFMLRSSWLSRGVSTCPGATREIVSEACPSTKPVGNTLVPAVQPTQFLGYVLAAVSVHVRFRYPLFWTPPAAPASL